MFKKSAWLFIGDEAQPAALYIVVRPHAHEIGVVSPIQKTVVRVGV